MIEQLKNIRKQIIAASLIFILALVLGGIHSSIDPAVAEKMFLELEPLIDVLIALEGWKLAAVIFINNGLKIFASIILGIVFGLFPAIFLFANGYLLGIIAHYYGPFVFVAGIIPHGILEIPALLIGTGAGIRLGWVALKKRSDIKKEVALSLKIFVVVILPLLFTASLIEVYITPLVLESVLPV